MPTLDEVRAKSEAVIAAIPIDLTRLAARELIKRCYEKGLLIRITDGYRSIAEQQRIYNQGRTPASKARGESIVSNAKPGSSFHNYGLAFDIVFIDSGYNFGADMNKNNIIDIIDVATQAKLLGMTWGGDFKKILDQPHFEFNFGLSGRELMEGKRWTRIQMETALAHVQKMISVDAKIETGDQAMTEAEKKAFDEVSAKVEVMGKAVQALEQKVNISGNQTPPSWAEEAIKAAKDAGFITKSNDKSQIFFEMLQTLYNAGLIKGTK